MPRLVLPLLVPVALVAGCSAPTEEATIANPAATSCIDQGGTYTFNTTDEAGGTCTLPDGRTVDAWELLRANTG